MNRCARFDALAILLITLFASTLPRASAQPAAELESFSARIVPLQLPALRPLQRNMPPAVDAPALEAASSDAALAVPLRDRMDSEPEFRAELARLKEWAAPFMRDLTPPLPTRRPRLDLTTCEFRLETEADRRDPQRLFTDTTEKWEPAKIPDYRGPEGTWAGFYRVRFSLPDGFTTAGQRVMLHFEGVDYGARVWLNGGWLGEHTGFFAPFEFDATDLLRPTDNVLLVRVESEIKMMDGMRGGRKIDGVLGPGVSAANLENGAGIWRPLWLESRPAVHVTQVFIRPMLRPGEANHAPEANAEAWVEIQKLTETMEPADVRFDLFARNFETSSSVDLKFAQPGVPVMLAPGINTVRITLRLENMRSWTPDTPWLYTARARLVGPAGQTLDAAQDVFGWRRFEVDESATPKGLHKLNGAPIFLRSLVQGGSMERAALEGNREQILEDLLIYKLANCNNIMYGHRPASREVYELADQVGLTIESDFPLAIKVRNDITAQMLAQVGEMERATRIHPSNILVTFFDEPSNDAKLWQQEQEYAAAMSVADLHRFFIQAEEMTHLYNPDRAVKWIEGVNACGYAKQTDQPRGFHTSHYFPFYGVGDGYGLGEQLAGVLTWVRPGWVGTAGGLGVPGLDEWRTISETWPAEWRPAGLDQQWDIDKNPAFIELKTFQPYWIDRPQTAREWIDLTRELQARLVRETLDAVRRRADVIVHAPVFYAIERLPGAYQMGLVDAARRPKPAWYEVADAHTPLAVNIDLPKTRYFAGEPLAATFWIFNDLAQSPAGARLAWQVFDGERVLFQQSAPANISPLSAKCQGRFAWLTPATDARRPLRLRLALLDSGGGVLHDHSQSFEIFPTPAALAPELSVHQLGDLLSPELMRQLGLRPAPEADADLIVATDLDALSSSTTIAGRVQGGAGLILIDAAAIPIMAEVVVGPLRLRRLMGPDPTMFVSRRTGHPAVAAFAPRDFDHWFYPGLSRMDWLYRGIGFEPTSDSQTILTIADRTGKKIDVAAEYPLGQGRVIAASLFLREGAMETNPIAREFFKAMLQAARRK